MNHLKRVEGRVVLHLYKQYGGMILVFSGFYMTADAVGAMRSFGTCSEEVCTSSRSSEKCHTQRFSCE